jgi:hypothetical protein
MGKRKTEVRSQSALESSAIRSKAGSSYSNARTRPLRNCLCASLEYSDRFSVGSLNLKL